MSHDAHRPITSEQRLPAPYNGTIYTTIRKVAPEKGTPTIGSTMEAELGQAWADSYIIGIQKGPQGAPPDQLVIQHARIPSEENQLATNWEHTEVTVGSKQYEAVIRTVILHESEYSVESPDINTPMPVVAGGKFEGVGYVLYDRNCVNSGMQLEPTFRVDRRVFIIKQTNTGEGTGTWGVESNSESIVAPETPAPSGFGVKNGVVDSIGNGHAISRQENYPDASGNIIHELEGQEHDELTGAVIDTFKVLCNANAAKTLASVRRGVGQFVEVKPLDKWHSILIAAKINGAISSQTWRESRNISLPDTLEEVGIIWDSNHDKSEGASGVDNISIITEKNYSWSVSAEAAVVGSVMGRPYQLMKHGFKGAAEVTVTRTFHQEPPDIEIIPYAFNPVYGTLSIKGVSFSSTAQSNKNGVGDTSLSSGGRARFSRDDKLIIQQIGPVVHSDPVLQHKGDARVLFEVATAIGGSTPGGGFYPAAVATMDITGVFDYQLPASSLPLASGETYILHVDVRPWRLGWWIREVYTAKVP